jgi:hypothetical protein
VFARCPGTAVLAVFCDAVPSIGTALAVTTLVVDWINDKVEGLSLGVECVVLKAASLVLADGRLHGWLGTSQLGCVATLGRRRRHACPTNKKE